MVKIKLAHHVRLQRFLRVIRFVRYYKSRANRTGRVATRRYFFISLSITIYFENNNMRGRYPPENYHEDHSLETVVDKTIKKYRTGE